jgi:hypothetical protein
MWHRCSLTSHSRQAPRSQLPGCRGSGIGGDGCTLMMKHNVHRYAQFATSSSPRTCGRCAVVTSSMALVSRPCAVAVSSQNARSAEQPSLQRTTSQSSFLGESLSRETEENKPENTEVKRNVQDLWAVLCGHVFRGAFLMATCSCSQQTECPF